MILGLCTIQGYQTASPSTWENAAIKIPAASLGTIINDSWTLEFMLYKNGLNISHIVVSIYFIEYW